MRSIAYIIIIFLNVSFLYGQNFVFTYDGPDSLFVDDNCSVALDWGHPDQPTVTSNIGANIDSFYIYSISDGYELNEMVEAEQLISITYKAVDDQGNSDFFSFDIQITDPVLPQIIQEPGDATHACDELNIEGLLQDWYNDHGGLEATDNCELIINADQSYNEVLIAFNQSVNDNCGNTRSVEVTWTVTDQSGNTLQPVNAEFSTVDNRDPVFQVNPMPLDTTCNENIDAILEAWLDNAGGAVAVDDCSDDLVWRFLWQDNLGNSDYEYIGNKPYNLQMPKEECNYHVNISFIVQDDCGNQKGQFTSIDIVDDNSPYFDIIPPDTLLQCDVEIETPVVRAIDPCKGNLIIFFEESSNQGTDQMSYEYYNYDIVQTWSADDGCGYAIDHTRTISVRDTSSPEFVVPADISINCTQIENTDFTGIPSNINDNCSIDFEIEYIDNIIGSGCNYLVERQWTVTDISGNSTNKIQELQIVDLEAPQLTALPQDKIVDCTDTMSYDVHYFDWLNNFAYASFEDDCNQAFVFAAAPGSYDPEDPATFPGTAPGIDFLFSCGGTEQEVMFEQVVDFVFYDDCNNVKVFNRKFRVVDQEIPTFTECPNDTILYTGINDCEAFWIASFVVADDNCTGQPFTIDYNQLYDIDSQSPGDKDIPVDTLTIQAGPIDLHGLDLEEIINLQLQFFNMDADDINEYFVIRGEDGSILTTTPEIDEECGDFEISLSSLIPLETLELWLQDGYLELVLEPKIVSGGGVFSINDICGNSYVILDLSLTTASVSALDYSLYINGNIVSSYDRQIPLDTSFIAGEYLFEYKATDCGSNQQVCTQNITVLDTIAPELTCPEGITLTLDQDSCSANLQLPYAVDFDDNCASLFAYEYVAPAVESAAFLTFSYDSTSAQYIANNKTFSFENLPIGMFALNPELIIKVRGDLEHDSEYFELLDEEGQIISRTPEANCDGYTSKKIDLDEAQFNSWLADGMISIVARAQFADEAVNPCDESQINFDGDVDSVSTMILELRFDLLDLAYSISGATELTLTTLESSESIPMVNFNGGRSIVEYQLTDISGNTQVCELEVELLDEEAPVAICKNAVPIFINPSGVEDYILQPEELDDGSIDNCRIDSMAVIPNSFDCSLAGSTQEVMLYVWDAAGNVDSCLSSVKIETLILTPGYQAGVCAFDTLKLFANLPDAPPGIYSILWTKENNGFSSNEENPVRPNADETYSGTYTLEVTGVNGCFSTGFVEVFIEDLSIPEIRVGVDTICQDDQLILETDTYSGNVIYRWYQGIHPNGSLVEATSVPVIELNPGIGLNRFYVIVESLNCESLPSPNIEVQVLERPEATVNDPFISLCEGEALQLGTGVSGSGFEYEWWGPDSYFSDVQNPAIIPDVGIKNQGTYWLAISNAICSDTAQVEVLVNERPITPEITGDDVYCEGESIILSVTNITNADTYTWYLDGSLNTVQESNNLIIPGAQSFLEGSWQVQAKVGFCFSDTSEIHEVQIEELFEINASNSGPVCEGDSVVLFAPVIPGASYIWTTPDNDTLSINYPRIPAKNGLYQLEITTVAGCILTSSTEVEVVGIPEITALSNNAKQCIDGSECIEFFPSVFPNQPGYTYDWFGPNNYNSSDSIAVLCDAEPAMNGIYGLAISNGHCLSDTVYTEVSMTLIPSQPEISGTGTICENDTISLLLENYPVMGMDFEWSTPNGNSYQTSTGEFQIPHADQSHAGQYAVVAFNGSCYSAISDSFNVEVIDKPNQPVIWSDGPVCEGEPLKLFTQYVPSAVYSWDGPNGFYSNEQNPVIYPSDTLNEGIYHLTISVNGCTADLSEGLVVEVIRKPKEPLLIGEIDPLCISEANSELNLCLLNQEAGTEYFWYHNESGTLLGNAFDDCLTINDFGLYDDGLQHFYVVASNQGCNSANSELVEVMMNIIPPVFADAGMDMEFCNDSELFLEAVPNTMGSWLDTNPDILIVDENDANSQVMHLAEGDNYFVWTLTNGVCEHFSVDSVNIRITPVPLANDDFYSMEYNGLITLEPILNDINTVDCEIRIPDGQDIPGILEAMGNEAFRFEASPAFAGELRILYQLWNTNCPEKSNFAEMIIDVGDATDCFGVNVITPNGDGKNDNLHFPCLESGLYPKNKLTVFNQWGDQVYSASPYLNDWYGTYRDKDLPVGTYYYIMDLRNGSELLKGFFVIER